MMRKRYISALLVMLPALHSFAQNKDLTPTVQVTNAYQARIMESAKPAASVFIPDSLYQFDLNFDYDGFENPYCGSSDFNPFLTQLDFAPRELRYKKFNMRLGAGYALAPELDLVWDAKPEGRFTTTVFAHHDSYFGHYGGFLGAGSDSRSRVGANFRFDFKKANLLFRASYEGVTGKDSDKDIMRHYHSACVGLALKSNLDPALSLFRYGLRADYSFGHDIVPNESVNEQVVDVDAFADVVFGKHLLELDVDSDMAFSYNYSATALVVRPRYLFESGALSLSAGLAVGWCTSTGQAGHGHAVSAFPSLDLKWKAVPQKLILYATADMEAKPFSARDAALQARFFIRDTLKMVEKKYYLQLGLKGDIEGKFNYDICGGMRRRADAAVFDVSDLGVQYAHLQSLDEAYALLKLRVTVKPVSFGGSAGYHHYFHLNELSIVPPSITADAFVKYDITRRWELKVEADYQSFYRSNAYYADDFVDLSAQLRFNASSHLGFWLKGSNLLGQKLQYVPGYGRSERCFLGGVVLTF